MNRLVYFNYIEERLNFLAYRIESRGKLNILDMNLHSENFYLYLFNLLYNYELDNLNNELQNVPAIDLIDHKNQIIFQVSATCTKQKIEESLKKDIIKTYNKYRYKFISISKDASDLRNKTISNPHNINFSPQDDIYDINSILTYITAQSPSKLKDIYNFIKLELGNEVDVIKLDSNLATVINILSKEKWDDANKSTSVNSFEIERKISHNKLEDSKGIIDEYCVYYKKVDEKYSDFDEMGVNKSNSVLATIKREYLKCKKIQNANVLFTTVIENVKEIVINSKNFNAIPIDELDLCIDILVVDAFTRCKIFENPIGYSYVNS